jgi:MFS family permease
MASPAPADAQRSAIEGNIVRYYVFLVLQSFQLWMPVWIVYLQRQRGLSLTQITFLDVPFFLTQVLAEVPTGGIADRFGRRTSLLLGATVTAAGVLVFGLADGYALVLVSYVLWGVGVTLQSGADQAFLYDSLAALGRQTEYGRVYGRANAASIAAMLGASLLGAPLAAETSLATPVVVSAGIYAASAVVALTFREPPKRDGRLGYLETLTAGFGEVRRRPVLQLVMLFGIAASGPFFVTQYFMQPFLTGHGASVASLGLLLLPARLASVAASFAAHRVGQRLGAWTAMALMPAVAVGCCIGLAAWDSIYAFSLVPVAGAAGTVRTLLVSQYINDRIASDQRATIVSIYALLTALAASVQAPLYGYLADQHSLRFLYGFVAIVAACTVPAVLAWWRRAESKEAATTAVPAAAG